MEVISVAQEMESLLLDWFETIEEVELTDGDRAMLGEVAQSFVGIGEQALTYGIQAEDFEEWLRFEVLEHWSALMEDMELETVGAVPAFYAFVKEGEDRLYFQMLKRCMPVASQSA